MWGPREGHLAQTGRGGILVEKESRPWKIARYIAAKPVRAGMVGHAEEWPRGSSDVLSESEVSRMSVGRATSTDARLAVRQAARDLQWEGRTDGLLGGGGQREVIEFAARGRAMGPAESPGCTEDP